MAHSAMVSITGLLPGVSLILSGILGGWKFHGWSRHDGQVIMVRPEMKDAVRSFPSVADAAAYFRERYGSAIESEGAAYAQREAARGQRDRWLS